MNISTETTGRFSMLADRSANLALETQRRAHWTPNEKVSGQSGRGKASDSQRGSMRPLWQVVKDEAQAVMGCARKQKRTDRSANAEVSNAGPVA